MPLLRLTLVTMVVLAMPTRGPAQTAPPLFKTRHDGMVYAVAFSPDGKLLASGGQDGKVVLTDVATGREVRRLTTVSEVRSVVFAHDGKMLGVKNQPGVYTIWDVATGNQTRESPQHNTTTSLLAFSKDGTELTAAGPWEYSYWQYTRGSMSSSRGGHMPGSYAALSSDGRTIAWGGAEGNVQVMEPRIGNHRSLRVGPATAAAFTPDGKSLITVNKDRCLRFWDVARGTEVRKISGARGVPGAVVVSADGQTLATAGGQDTAIRLWNVVAGRETAAIGCRPAGVLGLALSPDGKVVATAGDDGRVRVYHADRLAEPAPVATNLSERELEPAYDDLASDDPTRARQAFATLLANSAAAVKLIETRIRQAAALSVDPRVARLIADLDADDYLVREQASAELAKLGDAATPALRQALTGNPPPEVKYRARKLLDQSEDRWRLTPEMVRVLEGLEVLVQLATPEARQALEALAHESLQAQVIQEVRASLERLPK